MDIQGPGSGHSKKTYHKPGPPPHAPAHGYRHKHQNGHELEYNSQAGAYIVLNVPETYFGNNLYIRLSANGCWMVSTTLEGGLRVAVGNEVPHSLKEYKGKKKSNLQRKVLGIHSTKKNELVLQVVLSIKKIRPEK